MTTPQVICFGEILWDLLPTGKVAGGAPMNVAYQLNQLGVSAGMISRIGQDALGAEIFQFLQSKNVPTAWVQRDALHPTGIVNVELNEKGHPAYEIVENVAWDYIEAGPALIETVKAAQAFVFGSLVARSPVSKNSLSTLLENARLRVFDVNLRKPFFSKELLGELLPLAQLVKMNDDELDILSGWFGFRGDQQAKSKQVKDYFQLQLLIVTRGEHGALALDHSGFYTHPGYRVDVVDTIGSGDAFLAGYLSRYLQEQAPAQCLDFACRMGAFVASRRGGTPVFDLEGA